MYKLFYMAQNTSLGSILVQPMNFKNNKVVVSSSKL